MWSARSICKYENDCLEGMTGKGQTCCEIIRLSKPQSLSNVETAESQIFSVHIVIFIIIRMYGARRIPGLIALCTE